MIAASVIVTGAVVLAVVLALVLIVLGVLGRALLPGTERAIDSSRSRRPDRRPAAEAKRARRRARNLRVASGRGR